MAFPYFPHTEEDIRKMLDKCSMSSIDDLYSDVPSDFIYSKEYDLPEALCEIELRKYFEKLDAKNRKMTVFCGQGAYDHYCPAAVHALLSRSEFLTAYTPYQAEISQGTLRYIFEYQSMICSLTGMDVSNASMYDGATSAAEAMLMMLASTKKKTKVLISDTLLPQVCKVVETYAHYHGVDIVTIPSKDGQTSLEALENELNASEEIAGAIVPSTNRFGIIEDLSGFSDALHSHKALLAVYADPSSLAVLKTPAGWGADIACGEAQSLGIPLCFGGPYLGYLACRKDFVRKLPGRIVGATTDTEGKRAFVLTLQAREQHIRREKATSNICSNESLMALYVTIYMSLMGPEGLKKVNELSYAGAHYLYGKLLETGHFSPVFDKPFLKEFILKTDLDAHLLRKTLAKNGILGGIVTKEGYVTFCVTEKRSKEEIDTLVDIVKEVAL